VDTEATNAALTPAAVSKSISKTEWTTNARRYSVWTSKHRWQHVCRYRSLYSVKMLQGCWIHVSGDVSRSVHSFSLRPKAKPGGRGATFHLPYHLTYAARATTPGAYAQDRVAFQSIRVRTLLPSAPTLRL
jgi:hypothetical protein